VPVDGGTVGIECTSVHIASSIKTPYLYAVEPAQSGPKDLSYKLASAIRAKSRKTYTAANVLLSIDATNIDAQSGAELPATQAAEAIAALTPPRYGPCFALFSTDTSPRETNPSTASPRRSSRSTEVSAGARSRGRRAEASGG
jgi:hypothetical protein